MRIALIGCMCLLVVEGLRPAPLPAQVAGAGTEVERSAYYRLVAEHFSVAVGEVAILSEGVAEPDELPVLLRLSRASGISPAALAARRRSGESWIGIARRYGLHVGTFYISIPNDQVRPQVERIHELFSETPSAGWGALEVSDEELVVLANLDLFNRELGVSIAAVLDSQAETGSFVTALRALVAAQPGP